MQLKGISGKPEMEEDRHASPETRKTQKMSKRLLLFILLHL